jgi:hypothetical protein
MARTETLSPRPTRPRLATWPPITSLHCGLDRLRIASRRACVPTRTCVLPACRSARAVDRARHWPTQRKRPSGPAAAGRLQTTGCVPTFAARILSCWVPACPRARWLYSGPPGALLLLLAPAVPWLLLGGRTRIGARLIPLSAASPGTASTSTPSGLWPALSSRSGTNDCRLVVIHPLGMLHSTGRRAMQPFQDPSIYFLPRLNFSLALRRYS